MNSKKVKITFFVNGNGYFDFVYHLKTDIRVILQITLYFLLLYFVVFCVEFSHGI